MACRLSWIVLTTALALGACGESVPTPPPLPNDDAALIDSTILLIKGWQPGKAEPGAETTRRVVENGIEFTHTEKNSLIATAVEMFQEVKDSAWQREQVTVRLPEKCVLEVHSALTYSAGDSKQEFHSVGFEQPKTAKYDLRNITRLDMELVKRFQLWLKLDLEGKEVACTGDPCQDKMTVRSKTAVRGDAPREQQAALLEDIEKAMQAVKKSCPLAGAAKPA
jgi:hypothetical protein